MVGKIILLHKRVVKLMIKNPLQDNPFPSIIGREWILKSFPPITGLSETTRLLQFTDGIGVEATYREADDVLVRVLSGSIQKQPPPIKFVLKMMAVMSGVLSVFKVIKPLLQVVRIPLPLSFHLPPLRH